MRLRAVILDDHAGIRQALWALCDGRGYEVFTFPSPGLCPLHVMDRCPCAPGITCADIILSDLNMPQVQGLNFVEALVAKGCAVPHIALMSGEWSDADEARAAHLGCRLFRKPFSLADITAWLTTVEARVPPDRGLLAWDSCAWGRQTPAQGARP
jgi:DNA-binding response OmpR family regulator